MSSPDGPVCVVLGAGDLVDLAPEPMPTVTVTSTPSAAPESSPTPELLSIKDDVTALRVMFLCVGGLLIFLLAALLMRIRRL